ncbi:MAG TPA: hypothetical protein VFG65_04240 [Fimbriimonadales bacterium]|nr:hypothetical protein [Fimbriimonadales bacterium]
MLKLLNTRALIAAAVIVFLGCVVWVGWACYGLTHYLSAYPYRIGLSDVGKDVIAAARTETDYENMANAATPVSLLEDNAEAYCFLKGRPTSWPRLMGRHRGQETTIEIMPAGLSYVAADDEWLVLVRFPCNEDAPEEAIRFNIGSENFVVRLPPKLIIGVDMPDLSAKVEYSNRWEIYSQGYSFQYLFAEPKRHRYSVKTLGEIASLGGSLPDGDVFYARHDAEAWKVVVAKLTGNGLSRRD